MRQFSKLRYLSAPRRCFVDELGASHPLYTFLPPRIETLYLDQDGAIGDAEYEARLKVWLLDVLEYRKDRFPLLKSVMLSQWDDEGEYERFRLEEIAVLSRLSLSTAFEKTGVQLNFHFQWG